MEYQRSHFTRRTGLTEADLALLGATPLFNGMTREAIETLLAETWVQSFSRNTLLFLQEDPATRFYVIFDGWVKLFRETEDGDESIIAIFTRGESFAEAAIFDMGIFPVSAAVVDDSRLLVVPAEPFVRRLRENGQYALNMMASMSRHLRGLVRQIEQLSARSSAERLASFLVKLCPAEQGQVVVTLPLDKALIAGRLGMQPETFSRSLAKLRKVGVENQRNEVAIADVAMLRNFSEGQRLR